jgi:hypothetical protein
MLKLISKGALIAAVASLALAGSMTESLAQKKKAAAAAPPKPACTAGQLCTGPCSESKWCSVHWCQAGGTTTATFGVCYEGSYFCPQKC